MTAPIPNLSFTGGAARSGAEGGVSDLFNQKNNPFSVAGRGGRASATANAGLDDVAGASSTLAIVALFVGVGALAVAALK